VLTPYAISVAASLASQTVDYSFTGGVGPYRTYSSDETLVTVDTPAAGVGAISGTFVATRQAKIPAATTNVTITIVDSLGHVATGTYTVVRPAS
jgi:hypothetical protein